MQDIADCLGISKVSVSKALAGHKGVSETLRQTILQTAQQMNYSLPSAEGAFRFAFIVSKRFFLETDAFYSEMFYYFNKQCLNSGHSTALMIVSNHDEENGVLPIQLEKECFHGIAIAGQMRDSYLKRLSALQKPMVLMDFESQQINCDVLLMDNFLWGYRAAQYLIDRGHRKIGFMGQVGATNSITDRYFGYRKALLLNNLPFHPEWQLVNNDERNGLYYSSITLPEDMPSAFVCHCDRAAFYLLESLAAKGIRCPEDVSLVSFDNTQLAQLTQPALTSVNIDTGIFAQQALKTLLALQRFPHAKPQRFYIPADWVRRDSVADWKAAD